MDQFPQAAVAIIEVFEEGQKHWLILQRKISLQDKWSGQLCFAGGKYESSDADLLETAIRETFEETQIQLSREQCVRVLEDCTAGQGKVLVRPFLFKIAQKAEIVLNLEEMNAGWWVSESEFKNSQEFQFAPLAERSDFKTTGRMIQNQILWGFTLRLMNEVCTNY
jgi:8-oxo-dGTP pyrophosphatase MutT (NUDIX family)